MWPADMNTGGGAAPISSDMNVNSHQNEDVGKNADGKSGTLRWRCFVYARAPNTTFYYAQAYIRQARGKHQGIHSFLSESCQTSA